MSLTSLDRISNYSGSTCGAVTIWNILQLVIVCTNQYESQLVRKCMHAHTLWFDFFFVCVHELVLAFSLSTAFENYAATGSVISAELC